VHGYVSEEKLLDLYARSHCAVVPLRFGAGVKGKVLEAIQFGVPLVTTTVGAEGIPDAERVMAIADDASAFATAIAEALDASPESSFTSKSWIEKYFSAEKAEAAISALIDPPSTRQ
jgi:glycosyltransferase involved in cell wall biosynthesis